MLCKVCKVSLLGSIRENWGGFLSFPYKNYLDLVNKTRETGKLNNISSFVVTLYGLEQHIIFMVKCKPSKKLTEIGSKLSCFCFLLDLLSSSKDQWNMFLQNVWLFSELRVLDIRTRKIILFIATTVRTSNPIGILLTGNQNVTLNINTGRLNDSELSLSICLVNLINALRKKWEYQKGPRKP
jgi:hypothetical protein